MGMLDYDAGAVARLVEAAAADARLYPNLVLGGIVHDDPLIIITKYSAVRRMPLGLVNAVPEIFRRRRALAFVGIMRSVETDEEADNLAQNIKQAAVAFPRTTIVLLANTEREHQQFTARGLRALLANELIFTDDTAFAARPAETTISYDAIYVAETRPQKRHHLAKEVRRLALAHYKPTDLAYHEACRRALPMAEFLNYADGDYRPLAKKELVKALHASGVGLCLSAEEGAMPASAEYLLCGLPVVSTHNRGGRDRYLKPPYAVSVAPTPSAVRVGVEWLISREIDPELVRNSTMTLLESDRARFLADASVEIARTFGPLDIPFSRYLAARPLAGRPAWEIISTISGAERFAAWPGSFPPVVTRRA